MGGDRLHIAGRSSRCTTGILKLIRICGVICFYGSGAGVGADAMAFPPALFGVAPMDEHRHSGHGSFGHPHGSRKRAVPGADGAIVACDEMGEGCGDMGEGPVAGYLASAPCHADDDAEFDSRSAEEPVPRKRYYTLAS
jgi:hypothetical protein